ncbi:hypothetical protein [Aquitalea sp.]|uniref:hypothetical protein n=1 Tax=Aquitalea sp. TaxID=1872623 RepID=UPI002589FA89|nr:hypothetical protein [Aquitalea sp.]
MNLKPPFPTDNIYKFYALFGLALFITSILSILYITNVTNEIVFQNAVEYEKIKNDPHPNAVDLIKKKVIERKVEIAKSDKDFESRAVGVLAGVAVLLMLYGFHRWHTVIQPKQDELLELQIKKAKLELRRRK